MKQKINKFLIYNQDKILIHKQANTFNLPTEDTFGKDFIINNKGFLVITNEHTNVYSFDVDDSFICPRDYHYKNLREKKEHHYEENYLYAIQGQQVLNWSRKHKFCGVCGSTFNPMNHDRSKSCPKCGNLQFPQTSMAVIAGIIKDDQILLAHNTNFPIGLYSLVAGFVELGETLEQALQREIMEEVGIKVKNIRYFGSQPWPFPNSMMIGYLADYDSGEINTDDIEIESAHWYSPDNLPDIPHEYSIARKIINYYLANKKSL